MVFRESIVAEAARRCVSPSTVWRERNPGAAARLRKREAQRKRAARRGVPVEVVAVEDALRDGVLVLRDGKITGPA